MHCRLSGSDGYFTVQIENLLAFFLQIEHFIIYSYQISIRDCQILNVNRKNGVTSPHVSNRLTSLRHNTLNLIIGLLEGPKKIKKRDRHT